VIRTDGRVGVGEGRGVKVGIGVKVARGVEEGVGVLGVSALDLHPQMINARIIRENEVNGNSRICITSDLADFVD
jgi:hypothetical protein